MCINPSEAKTRVVVEQGTTFKRAREIFVQQNGVSGEWRTYTSVLKSPDTCFGILYWQGARDVNKTGKVIPGSYCGSVPPEKTVCNIHDSLLFDYGEVQSGDVNGRRKTVSLSIQCSQTANVKFALVGEKSIKLGGGVESFLYIDNKDISNGVTIAVQEGTRLIDVVSELSVIGNPEGGAYSGTGVIIVDYR